MSDFLICSLFHVSVGVLVYTPFHLLRLSHATEMKQECSRQKNYPAVHKTLPAFVPTSLLGATNPLENEAANPINFCRSQTKPGCSQGGQRERGGQPAGDDVESRTLAAEASPGMGLEGGGRGRLADALASSTPLSPLPPCAHYLQPL